MPTFDSLVGAIHSAVLQATDIAESHELERIQQQGYWYTEVNRDGSPVVDDDGNPIYRPRMITMRLPVWEDGVLMEKDIPVPMQSMTTGQSLRISELTVDMEVELQGLDGSGSDEGSLMVSTNVGGNLLKKSNKARVSVTFTGQDPPEGYARIDNQLIKLLP
jgi:hypothetical protein|tara:strand:+ start:38 stop:523 length:486 start_codon:yes stop_codon:yes gene_type:complete